MGRAEGAQAEVKVALAGILVPQILKLSTREARRFPLNPFQVCPLQHVVLTSDTIIAGTKLTCLQSFEIQRW